MNLNSIIPKLSYTIWFSQRTGSTLLCRALQSIGIAGNPSEWLTLNSTSNLLDKYQLDSYAELQQKIWQIGTTPNGVLGVKTGAYEPYFSSIIEIFRQFPCGDRQTNNRVEIWENVFPNCKHIYMTRRNKVRLAVSWWKAIQTQEWHREQGKLPLTGDLKNKYCYDAINHLFAECSMREAAIQEFFSEGSIVPLTIVYEDFILACEQTIRNILDYLEVSDAQNIFINSPQFQQLADDVSEEWVQRFRQERQQGWKNFW
jgi:trehalose 2-sulfotransferase